MDRGTAWDVRMSETWARASSCYSKMCSVQGGWARHGRLSGVRRVTCMTGEKRGSHDCSRGGVRE